MLNEIASSGVSSADIIVGEVALWAIWMATMIVAVVFSAIFFYHWKKYDWEDRKIRTGAWIFLVGTAILLLASGLTVFFIF